MRWQVATRRGVAASVGRKDLRDARIMDRRKFEQGMETSNESFDKEFLERVILPEANKWIRPFPPEGRIMRPGVIFYRGMPSIEWEHIHFRSLDGLNRILRRLLPHIRPRGGVIELESAPISQLLAHPVLGRIDHLGISMSEPGDLLLAFLLRFSDTNLPERIE